ncbi:MAG: hypothetical protein Q9191_006017 [Dirinaria sp. TL-2023a]
MLKTLWSRRCHKLDPLISRLPLRRHGGFYIRNFATQLPAATHNETLRKRRYWLYGACLASGFAASLFYLWYRDDEANGALNPHDFTSYRLVSREAVSSTSSLFVLRPHVGERTSEVYDNAWRNGVWSVQIKQPQLQIARSYTPLPPLDTSDRSNLADLRLLIRKHPGGEVSDYLHKLALNAEVELRGPRTEYEIPEQVKELVFLAGGTGIAPALQMAHSLLDRSFPNDPLRPRIRILWANRKAEDAIGQSLEPQQSGIWWRSWFGTASELHVQPMSAEEPPRSSFAAALNSLKSKYQDRLRIDYYIDEQKTFIDEDVVKKCLDNGDAETASISEPAHSHRRLLIVSGPEGFVNHFAGPKVWSGGEEVQGPPGGLLRRLNTRGWEIWKL